MATSSHDSLLEYTKSTKSTKQRCAASSHWATKQGCHLSPRTGPSTIPTRSLAQCLVAIIATDKHTRSDGWAPKLANHTLPLFVAYLMMLGRHFAWQAQHLALLQYHFWWQGNILWWSLVGKWLERLGWIFAPSLRFHPPGAGGYPPYLVSLEYILAIVVVELGGCQILHNFGRPHPVLAKRWRSASTDWCSLYLVSVRTFQFSPGWNVGMWIMHRCLYEVICRTGICVTSWVGGMLARHGLELTGTMLEWLFPVPSLGCWSLQGCCRCWVGRVVFWLGQAVWACCFLCGAVLPNVGVCSNPLCLGVISWSPCRRVCIPDHLLQVTVLQLAGLSLRRVRVTGAALLWGGDTCSLPVRATWLRGFSRSFFGKLATYGDFVVMVPDPAR